MMNPEMALFFANIAVSVPLIIWMRSESRSDWKHMDEQMRKFHDEMKEFHARHERLDAVFKAFLMKEKK